MPKKIFHLRAGWGKTHSILLGFLIFTLAVNLATRTFRLSGPHTKATAQSSIPHNSKQHMDQDADEWVPPHPHFSTLEATGTNLQIAPAESTTVDFFTDSALHKRPPPSI